MVVGMSCWKKDEEGEAKAHVSKSIARIPSFFSATLKAASELHRKPSEIGL
jgi:hypothetical protein